MSLECIALKIFLKHCPYCEKMDHGLVNYSYFSNIAIQIQNEGQK